jgi:cytochrome c oxidase subunit 3
MTPQRTLDVSHLKPYSISNEAPLWWGQVFLALVEGVMFCILIAMYFYYRLSVDVWPPPGVQLPTRVMPALCTLLLLLSCIGSYKASEAAKKNDVRGMISGLTLNMVLAVGGMMFRAMEWGLWNYKWNTGVYGSITWAILFLHTVDVLADMVFTLVLIILLNRGATGPMQRLGVHVDSIIWYFLVGIWIPLYITVFWGPYFLPGQL